jgi:PAS domain S-box-containing protein
MIMNIKKVFSYRSCFILVMLLLPIKAITQYVHFKHLSTENGLSQNSINSIVQDNYGFMWFGTDDGLNKFDAHQFTIYRNDPSDYTSISDNKIQAILVDQNDLWVGTSNGLNKYNYLNDNFIQYFHDNKSKKSIADNNILSLFKDKKGRIWIGTRKGLNLYKREQNNFYLYQYIKSDTVSNTSNYVWAISENCEGKLWLNNLSELYTFDPEHNIFSGYPLYNSTKQQIIAAYIEDDICNTWVGTLGSGLFYINKSSKKIIHYKHNPAEKNSLCHDAVLFLLKDEEKNIWILTNAGLSCIPQNTNISQNQLIFDNFIYSAKNQNGLSTNILKVAYLDNEKRLWIGGQFGGLNILDKKFKKFNHYKFTDIDDRFKSNNMTAVAEDKEGNLWFGTDEGGIYYWDRKNNVYKVFRFNYLDNQSIASNKVLALCLDSYDNLWIGMWNEGIDRLNIKTNVITHFKNIPGDNVSLANNYVFNIFEDRQKNLWIGLWSGGLNMYDREHNCFKRYPVGLKDSISLMGNSVTTLFQDHNNNIWIGTEDAGLSVLRKSSNTFKNYTCITTDSNTINNNYVNAICEDSQQRLWIGTKKGLNMLDRKRQIFKRYNAKTGLPEDNICGILEDVKGNLWLSGNKGIYKLSVSEEKNRLKLTSKNFNKFDGLQDNLFNRWSYLKTSKGELIFGGVNGVNIFCPDSIKDNTVVLPIVITGFNIFNKPVTVGKPGSPLKIHISATKEIILSYQQSVISFEYATLDFTNPEKNKYQYKLEGFENDWNYVGTERKATYTNLNPGKYIFRVKGCNSDGYWNEQDTSIRIIILPPWWKTWWFRSVIFLCILVVLDYFLSRIIKRIQHLANQSILNEQNQLKTLINNIPDQVFIKDNHSRFLYINKSTMSFMGRKNEKDFFGKTDFDFYPKPFADIFFKKEQEIISTGIPVINEEKTKVIDNKTFYYSTTKCPIKNQKGETIGLVGIVRDITEQKMAQFEIEKQSEELKVYNTILNESNTILEERQQQIEEQSEELKANNDKLLEKQKKIEEQSEELRAHSENLKDINDLLVEKQKLILTQSEQLKENNQQLTLLNATKDRFFSIIAHDLRNPFNVIMGFSEILLKKINKLNPEKIQKYHKMIFTSSVNVNSLLENLLQWSRSQTDRIYYEPAMYNLFAITEETIKLLKTDAEQKNITIQQLIDPNIMVHVDENMIKTVFRNLISNAIKFTNENGRITLKLQIDDQIAIVSVADTGVGISAETISKLFRVDTIVTTKGTSKESGTGLGLLLCKDFVEKHNGKIWVESILGKGSEFKFTLPLP